MKLKYFLRGLGVGIIFTVMVLGISGGNVEKETLTDNEIMARARELGMVTKDEKLEETLSQILDNQLANEEDNSAETEKEETNAADTETSGGETQESVLPDPLEEEETKVVSKVTISEGMSSRQVATAFKQLGIIDDAEAFDAYLCNNGYALRIGVGTFTIEGKPDYAELARIITLKQ